MANKVLLFFCVQAFLAKLIIGQCLNAGAIGIGNVLAAGYGAGLGCAANGIGVAANGLVGNANGGGLTVTSTSPIAPTGLSVVSDYVIEGPVAVAGELPFLSAVAVDGQVPAGGQAGTTYACGSGNVGIVSEGLSAGAGVAGGYGAGAGLTGLTSGYGTGLAGGLGLGAGRGLAGGLSYGNGLRNGRGGCGRAIL